MGVAVFFSLSAIQPIAASPLPALLGGALVANLGLPLRVGL
jgi:hypothetical protein